MLGITIRAPLLHLINFIILSVIVVLCGNESIASNDIKGGNDPVDIISNKLYYDKRQDLVYAVGDVVVMHNNQTIVADEITYYRDTEEIYALGNIALSREDGSVYFGDKARFNRVKNAGIITNFKGRFGKQSLMAAGYVEVVSENVTEFNEVVYSACNICSANFVPDTPLWQFRAKSAELNREEERIYYKDTKLEAFGYPVFYTPYLVTPMPGAKNKSGFLVPEVRYSNTFGAQVRIPYYQVIYPNMDATFGAKLSAEHGNIYDLEFRHKLKNGEYKIFSSITHTDKYTKSGSFIPGKKDFRGHYDLRGRYQFNKPYLRGLLTVDSKRVMDPTKTYTKKYNFAQEDVLRTDVHYRGINANSYYSVRNLFFQDLRPNTSAKTTAAALPQATYIYSGSIPIIGAKGEVLLDYTNLNRSQGMNYNRLINIWSVEKNYMNSFGVIWKNNASLRGDFYNVDFNAVKVASNYIPKAKRSGSETRFHPELTSSFNWPLYNLIDKNFIAINPIVQLAFSPKQSNLQIVDNEDSQAPEISASNLFTPNRYRGYDLLENGNRASYGVISSVKSLYLKDLSVILGQSFRFDKDRNFDKASGMGGYKSDYVAKVSLKPDENWQITNGTRFDSNNFTVNRNEFGVNYSDAKYMLSIYHFMVNTKILDPSKQDSFREEIQISAGYNFYKQWWIDGFIKSKLSKISKRPTGQATSMISDGISFRNSNECLFTEIGVQRNYTRLKDLTPETSYIFRVIVPTF